MVNPKLKCHPNVQSRNVIFLLAQDTEFATALFCLQGILAEVEAAPGVDRKDQVLASAWLPRARQLAAATSLRLLFLVAVLVSGKWCRPGADED